IAITERGWISSPMSNRACLSPYHRDRACTTNLGARTPAAVGCPGKGPSPTNTEWFLVDIGTPRRPLGALVTGLHPGPTGSGSYCTEGVCGCGEKPMCTEEEAGGRVRVAQPRARLHALRTLYTGAASRSTAVRTAGRSSDPGARRGDPTGGRRSCGVGRRGPGA